MAEDRGSGALAIVHAERTQGLPRLHDEQRELSLVLARLRWRLGLERVLHFGLRGAMGSAMVFAGVSLSDWLIDANGSVRESATALAVGLPLLLALGLAALRWPSERQAALAADRRLGLDARLTTAVELSAAARRSASGGRFDGLQVLDAVQRARAAPSTWLTLGQKTRPELALATVLVMLAALSVLLPTLGRPSWTGTNAAASGLKGSSTDGLERLAPPVAAGDPPIETAQPAPQPLERSDADLAARVQQEQAARTALDALSSALRQLSAGQPAADAIERGDFASAQSQLASLGEEADQLSDLAKQQLASALQQAANATSATDRQLADRERQASQALSRNNYQEQRTALRNLAEQVQQSGARSAPADQLARDAGRLQQQQSRAGQGDGAQSQTSAATGAAARQSGANTGTGGTGDGTQQGGPGAGIGANPNGQGDQMPRLLDGAGQEVTVPTMLGQGPGVRPTDGTEDQTGTDPTSATRSVSELVQAQQTGQVAPEQNLVQGDQRPIVRGYFR